MMSGTYFDEDSYLGTYLSLASKMKQIILTQEYTKIKKEMSRVVKSFSSKL